MFTEPTILPERGIVRLSGAEAHGFLENLISNRVSADDAPIARYAALLTPQGKYLFDFFVIDLGDRILLDTARDRLADLVRRLMLYRLRAKVEIEDVSDQYRVVVEPRSGREPGAIEQADDEICFADPRLAELGLRTVEPISVSRDQTGDPEAYRAHCMALGVPGAGDLAVEKSFLLESGFDELHGVDFRKGCFVGQELTARTKYRGLVRKRLLPARVDGPLPAPETPITANGKEIGETRSAMAGLCLGLYRLDRLKATLAEQAPIRAGEASLEAYVPAWMNVSLEPETEDGSSDRAS